MAVSELITLGIGTPSDIPHFLTFGLDLGAAPPPPPPVVTQTGGGGIVKHPSRPTVRDFRTPSPRPHAPDIARLPEVRERHAPDPTPKPAPAQAPKAPTPVTLHGAIEVRRARSMSGRVTVNPRWKQIAAEDEAWMLSMLLREEE